MATQRLVPFRSILIIGLANCLIFGFVVVLSAMNLASAPNDRTRIGLLIALLVTLGWVAMSASLIASYFFSRHEVSEQGLLYGRRTGSRIDIKWSELQRVKYVSDKKWFRLETQSGEVARVSAGVSGLREFAALLLAHTPASAIDTDTHAVLRATAHGYPPSIWQ